MHKRMKRLGLSKETLRELASDQLALPVGGAETENRTCTCDTLDRTCYCTLDRTCYCTQDRTCTC